MTVATPDRDLQKLLRVVRRTVAEAPSEADRAAIVAQLRHTLAEFGGAYSAEAGDWVLTGAGPNGAAKTLVEHLESLLAGVPDDLRPEVSRKTAVVLANRRQLPSLPTSSHAGLIARRAGEPFAELLAKIRSAERTLLDDSRLFVLWQAVRATAPLGLPSIEIGVYRGGGSAFLAECLRHFRGDSDIPHFAIDTFEGHHQLDVTPEDEHHAPGHFGDISHEDVQRYLSNYPAVRVVKGRFADVAPALPAGPVGLMHIDTDLLEPTRHALRFAVERLAVGGVAVVDDYLAAKCPGVVEAVREFADGHGSQFGLWEPFTEQAVLIRTAS